MINKILSLITVCIGMAWLSSCGSSARVDDMSNIGAFHKYSSSKEANILATDDKGDGGAVVDLYIDYSDCMTTANESPYYKSVQPAIIACNPNYYSIKGNAITFESNDKMKVHQLLNSITNVDFSNIKGAVDSIIKNRHEAMIITDGEFYQQGIGANLNNPYLADEFKQWLGMGLDVYVYSEPYQSGKFVKNRYYMLFTDHRLNNNIQQIFSRVAPSQNDVKMVHLYSGIPSAKVGKDGVDLNEQLLATDEKEINQTASYEWHILDEKWSNVFDYILNASDDNGNPIKGGDYYLKGIDLGVTAEDAYKSAEIEVKCYEISDLYDSFNPKAKKQVALPEPLKNMFVIDEAAWKKGNVVVKLDPAFDGSSLTGSNGNLLRLDICVKESKENFSSNPEIGDKFKFDSPYGYNTSVYESLKQTLLDPAISPEKSGNPVIYSIYLSTYSN